jgi:hypothetical protein
MMLARAPRTSDKDAGSAIGLKRRGVSRARRRGGDDDHQVTGSQPFGDATCREDRGRPILKPTTISDSTSAATASPACCFRPARHARETFGDDAGTQLAETLRIVGQTAKDLGIDVGNKVRALLDAHVATFAGGNISLHDETGVPLRGLGVGSTRLLIAGLQRKATAQSSIILVGELEHGLEPHRIIRFLGCWAGRPIPPVPHIGIPRGPMVSAAGVYCSASRKARNTRPRRHFQARREGTLNHLAARRTGSLWPRPPPAQVSPRDYIRLRRWVEGRPQQRRRQSDGNLGDVAIRDLAGGPAKTSEGAAMGPRQVCVTPR